MFVFYPLLARLSLYLSQAEIDRVERGFLFAANAHEDQFRSSGEPYVTHTVAAATILSEMHLDVDTIIAALLHDVIEDTEITSAEIADEFGSKVAELVEGVTKLTKIHFDSKAEAQAENFRKMMLAMTGDIRVILIKMADRLHNMRTLGGLAAAKRRRIAFETLEIYAPIAHRLGMHQFKLELEDLSFKAIYPWRESILLGSVQKARRHRRDLLQKVEHALVKGLAPFDVSAEQIRGREKSMMSVYRKIRDRGVPFSEIMDLLGFRIIAKDTADCYYLLGAVHSIFKPIPGKIKDYIAIPKANGYQSLHTLLFGPYGIPIEIQIRTREMDHVAENGIAAHWLYKTKTEVEVTHIQSQAKEWLKKVADIQKKSESSMDFIRDMKIDLFPDEVYVFTPKGEILSLPRGATALDFAYAVHTDIGNHAKEILVNRHRVPFSYPLLNGQSVEVTTDSSIVPKDFWLDFVVTGRAKSGIRYALKNVIKAVDGSEVKPLSRRKVKPIIVIYSRQGMNLELANCCHPIPGDPIRGFMNASHKVIVHASGCQHLQELIQNKNHGKWVDVRWAEQTSGFFPVHLTVVGKTTVGVMAGVTREMAEIGGDIREFSMRETIEAESEMNLVVEVQDRSHLAKMIRSVKRLTYVKKVYRS